MDDKTKKAIDEIKAIKEHDDEMERQNRLKPCPFCGCDINLYTPWYIKANESKEDLVSIDHPINGCILSCTLKFNDLRGRVITKWNTRT